MFSGQQMSATLSKDHGQLKTKKTLSTLTGLVAIECMSSLIGRSRFSRFKVIQAGSYKAHSIDATKVMGRAGTLVNPQLDMKWSLDCGSHRFGLRCKN